jgi:hypothetical protein
MLLVGSDSRGPGTPTGIGRARTTPYDLPGFCPAVYPPRALEVASNLEASAGLPLSDQTLALVFLGKDWREPEP